MNFSSILKDYPYTTELHAHSFPVSACGDFQADKVVDFYKEAGVTSLTLSNHLNPLWAEGSPRELAEKYLSDYLIAKEHAGNDMNVILGVEIRFPENGNDYLVYGVEESDLEHFISLIPYGIENFYKEVKNDKNVIFQAHPLRQNMSPIPFGSVDGIESINMHPSHHAKPSVAFKIAKENNLLVCGGSDFHHKNHHALCLMRTEKEMKNSFDVAEALKSKAGIFDCSGHIIIPYIY